LGDATSDQEGSAEVSEGSAEISAEDEAQLEAEAEALHASPESVRFRDVWQLPTLVASLGLLAIGLFMLMNSRPPNEYSEMLNNASESSNRGKYDTGLQILTELEPHLGELAVLDQARYHQIRGDLFYSKQMVDGGDLQSNLETVVREYRSSEEMGLPLTPEQIFRMTDSLISLSRIQTALDYFAKLSSMDSDRRHRVLKRLIERNLTARKKDYRRTYELLGQLTDEPDLSGDDRVWAEARMAELRMSQGFTDEAINGLLVAIQQLMADGINDLPELYVLLGRGYFEIGDNESARKHLNYAQDLLPAADSRRGQALLYLGKIGQAEDDWDGALSLFDLVVTDFPGTRSYLPALLGRAEVYARTGRHKAALDDFTLLITEAVRERGGGSVDESANFPEQVSTVLMTLHDRARIQDQIDLALRYLKLASRLFDDDLQLMQDELLLRLAETNELAGQVTIDRAIEAAIAKKQAEAAQLPPDSNDTILSTNQPDTVRPESIRLDPATLQKARRHFVEAGRYYAQRAALLQVDDPEGTIASLDLAANSYDRGGDLQNAVASLKEFIRLTANDPRQVKGIFKLGRVYQGLGDMDGAIAQFKLLIQDHPNTLEAHRSYVFLAQAHLQNEDHPDAAEAERLLLHVVNGDAGLTPEAPEYADALIELGTLYSMAKEAGLPLEPAVYYPKAIQRLTEATERYPNHLRITEVYYRLGHAYGKSADVLAEELKRDMPETDRRGLQRLRESHLRNAMAAYRVAIDRFESIPMHKRTRVEEQDLKFAKLWRADAAYSLGQYPAAIPLYNEVVERYENDVAALMALVQIVNTYAEMGDFRAARAAQNRARRLLKEMPDKAFADGLLNREAWEQWLMWERAIDKDQITSANPDSG